MEIWIVTVITTAAALVFGRKQLIRWNLWNSRYRRVIWIIGIAVISAGGILFGLYEYHWLKAARYLILMHGLLLIAFSDAARRIIPNRALAALLLVRLVMIIADIAVFPDFWAEILISSCLGFVAGGFLFLFGNIVTRGGAGMGDVKMAAVMGIYMGFQVLMSCLVITLLMTAVTGMVLLIFHREKDGVPLAPFAAVGTIITLLLGF